MSILGWTIVLLLLAVANFAVATLGGWFCNVNIGVGILDLVVAVWCGYLFFAEKAR